MIRRALRSIALLGLVLALPAFGATSKGLDEEFNLDVVQASGTFDLFAQIAGLEPVIDPGIAERKLTLRIEKVRVRTALDAACDSLECQWRVEGGKLIVEAKPRTPPKPIEKAALLDEPIDLKVTKAQATDILHTFGEILSVEVDLENGVSGELTLDLEATPVRAALDAVCKKIGCRWHIEEGARRRLVVSAKK